MNRHQRRQFERELGVQTKKMKRKRPPSAAVQQAMKDRAQERVDAQKAILGQPTEDQVIWVPAHTPPNPADLWVPR